MKMGRIVAVLRSKKKGVAKKEINTGYLRKDHGLVGDAHAGSGRQVSLLTLESIKMCQQKGLKVGPGDFAENLTTKGVDFLSLPKGKRIFIGKGIILEVTQIGKECPAPCAIFRKLGECIMPREGVFARVIRGGRVRAGDRLEVER
jgi:MOSC domain-containing protein YiiM